MTVTLPLWWSRGFPGEAARVREVRVWIERFLPACAPVEDLVMIASELAANAVTHTHSREAGGLFTIDLTWSPESARVVVGDQGSDEVPKDARISGDEIACAESGRGLLLVDALSAAWGVAGDAGPAGSGPT